MNTQKQPHIKAFYRNHEGIATLHIDSTIGMHGVATEVKCSINWSAIGAVSPEMAMQAGEELIAMSQAALKAENLIKEGGFYDYFKNHSFESKLDSENTFTPYFLLGQHDCYGVMNSSGEIVNIDYGELLVAYQPIERISDFDDEAMPLFMKYKELDEMPSDEQMEKWGFV